MTGKPGPEDRGKGKRRIFLSSSLVLSPPRCAIAVAMLMLIATKARSQQLSDLAPQQPISVEDARPVSYRALLGAVDWTFNEHRDQFNDYGPGFSLLYGAARGLETGASLRYVTRPGRNAGRGIASGDLFVHALYALRAENATWPALAFRAEVQLPTGLDSKGTDLHLALLATRSFDAFRLHGNFRYTRLGATSSTVRADRYEAIAGIDFLASRRGLTDSLLVADAVVRSNPIVRGRTIFALELGTRRRIGSQTILFAGAGSEFTGQSGRRILTLRLGLSHMY